MPAHRVLVPGPRLARWVTNFETRHGPAGLVVRAGGLGGHAPDGSRFLARLPRGAAYDGLPTVEAFVSALAAPGEWGVLLVRRGGFAVARLDGDELVASKVGSRHVQGRTAAGGQSQQRFARRRDNQARQAFEAAAGHAARVLRGLHGPLVCGGDREGVGAVLDDPRLRDLRVVEPWLPVPDPRRDVLEQAVVDGGAVGIEVMNA